jgi:hypothetical protein
VKKAKHIKTTLPRVNNAGPKDMTLLKPGSGVKCRKDFLLEKNLKSWSNFRRGKSTADASGLFRMR